MLAATLIRITGVVTCLPLELAECALRWRQAAPPFAARRQGLGSHVMSARDRPRGHRAVPAISGGQADIERPWEEAGTGAVGGRSRGNRVATHPAASPCCSRVLRVCAPTCGGHMLGTWMLSLLPLQGEEQPPHAIPPVSGGQSHSTHRTQLRTQHRDNTAPLKRLRRAGSWLWISPAGHEACPEVPIAGTVAQGFIPLHPERAPRGHVDPSKLDRRLKGRSYAYRA